MNEYVVKFDELEDHLGCFMNDIIYSLSGAQRHEWLRIFCVQTEKKYLVFFSTKKCFYVIYFQKQLSKWCWFASSEKVWMLLHPLSSHLELKRKKSCSEKCDKFCLLAIVRSNLIVWAATFYRCRELTLLLKQSVVIKFFLCISEKNCL